MPLHIETRFAFDVDQPTDMLLQFEAAALPEQSLTGAQTTLSPALEYTRVPAEDAIGERIWVRVNGPLEVDYQATVGIDRRIESIEVLQAMSPHDLPGEAVHYLLESRYCPADQFQPFVEAEFAGTSGGARVEAIRAWIADNFSYTPGSSGPETGAVESFIARHGVCRDYAHVLVTLCRASTIPARYVACYAPGVTPQDFHAVAEVFLADPSMQGGGTWQVVDATGMADPAETVKIGVGRDAADVSFLTSFGPSNFRSSSVKVTKE